MTLKRCRRCGERAVDGHLCPEVDPPKDEQWIDVAPGVVKDEKSGFFFFSPAALSRFNAAFATDDDAVRFDREELAAWLGQIVRTLHTQYGRTYLAPILVAFFWSCLAAAAALVPWFVFGVLLLAW